MNLRNKQFFRRFIAVNMTVASAFPANLPPSPRFTNETISRLFERGVESKRCAKDTLNLGEIGADLKLATLNSHVWIFDSKFSSAIPFFFFFLYSSKKRYTLNSVTRYDR